MEPKPVVEPVSVEVTVPAISSPAKKDSFEKSKTSTPAGFKKQNEQKYDLF